MQMYLQKELRTPAAAVQTLIDERFDRLNIQLDVLRLDEIHPVVSGNKWFKLKYYLQKAAENNIDTIATFGGAYSNHLLATAYACNKHNLKCIGFVRGEEPVKYSKTLQDVKALNMQLEFLPRKIYADKQSILHENTNMLFIPEGGYGETGAKGAAEILSMVSNLSFYNHIVCAAGTGTTLAGIANASMLKQQCIGISALKNNFSLEDEMFYLVNDEAKNRTTFLHDYNFGGYAKHTQQLFDFMNKIWTAHRLPLDFVYTAKALYAIYDIAGKNFFPPHSRILFIHSGGLQGNRSLPRDLLAYN